MHDAAPASENVPAKHIPQEVAIDLTELYVPAGQGIQLAVPDK